MDPDYGDFAYPAFTVGMTFQVSDTTIDERTIRRIILRHTLLCSVILAMTINVVADLLH